MLCDCFISIENETTLHVWFHIIEREVPGSIPRQGPRHKDVIKMVPVIPCLAPNIKKAKNWLFLKNKDRTKNVMDKIWDRNP